MNLLFVHSLAHTCTSGFAWPREGFSLDGAGGVPLDASVLLRSSDPDEVVEARLCGCDGAGVGPGLAWRA